MTTSPSESARLDVRVACGLLAAMLPGPLVVAALAYDYYHPGLMSDYRPYHVLGIIIITLGVYAPIASVLLPRQLLGRSSVAFYALATICIFALNTLMVVVGFFGLVLFG